MEDANPAVAAFIQEASEILADLECCLLDLEAEPAAERIDAVFRALHTIKGSGSMFGFGALARFTHHFEDAFDRIREGRLQVSQPLIDLSLKARDHMIELLACGQDGAASLALEQSDVADALLSSLSKLTEIEASQGQAADARLPSEESAVLRSLAQWRIRFRPDSAALLNGMRPDLLIGELATLGMVSVRLDPSSLPALDALDPRLGYLAWDIELTTDQPRSAIEAVFIFADDAELEISEVQDIVAVSDAPATQQNRAMDAEVPAKMPVAATGDSVRVPAPKLDEIMDQLGELVIAQARLCQMASASADPELETVVEEVERLVTSLRDATLSIRMLPIEGVFGKFRRVVRDLSGELNKDVTLVTEGGETEVDKTVIDRLSEPLVHMIRNSMDHGIEAPDIRKTSGKPIQGVVRLTARQEGGEVLIAIEDDGAGLNAESIRNKAIQQNLIEADSNPTDEELYQLIFAPGFSTAETLSSVSGRGVGMDAVRSTVDALRGSIDVWSRAGRGTRVTLRLPVTLAIIDGLLVRLDQTVFVIPLAVVEECVELNTADRRRESGRTMLCIREHLVPFLDLDDVFGAAPSTETRRRVVIVKTDGQRLGLVVDDILGQNQTVIKTLSQYHRSVEGFAGATILGDGSVALIIDVVSLARSALAVRYQNRNAA